MKRDWKQIRAAIEKLDVVRAPMIAATLRRLLEEWPEARSIFHPRVDLAIAAIKRHQKRERTKWLSG